MTALQIIENAYDMTLNPNEPYDLQLEPLAASGELANRIKANTILFKLCELVDAQAKEIKALKADREQIAKEMVTLGSHFGNQAAAKVPTKPIETPSTEIAPPIVSEALADPTQPLSNVA